MQNCMQQSAGGSVAIKAAPGASKAASKKSRTPRSRKTRPRQETPQKKNPVTPRKLFHESGEEESHVSPSPQRMIADRSPDAGLHGEDSGEDNDVFAGMFALKDIQQEPSTPSKSRSKRKRGKRSSPKKKKTQEKTGVENVTPTALDPVLSPDLLAVIPTSFNKTLFGKQLYVLMQVVTTWISCIMCLPRCDAIYLREIFVAEDITTLEDAADIFTVDAGQMY